MVSMNYQNVMLALCAYVITNVNLYFQLGSLNSELGRSIFSAH
jgi:hypothetical protein